MRAITRYELVRAEAFGRFARRNPLEIRAPGRIDVIGWSTTGLVAFTQEPRALFRIPRDELARDWPAGATYSIHPASRQWVSQDETRSMHTIPWFAPDASVILLSDHTRITAAGVQLPWRLTSNKAPELLGRPDFELQSLVATSKPIASRFIRAKQADQAWLLVVHENGSFQPVPVEQLEQNLLRFKLPPGIRPSLDAPVQAPDGLYLPLVDYSQEQAHFYGFAFVALPAAVIDHVVSPPIPSALSGYSTSENPLIDEQHGTHRFTVRRGANGEAIYISAIQLGESLEIWRLEGRNAPIRVAKRPLALAAARAAGLSAEQIARMDLAPRIEPTEGEFADAPCELVNLEGDAVFRFCFAGDSLSEVFPVGGSTVRIVEGTDDSLYVQVNAGNKIFRFEEHQE